MLFLFTTLPPKTRAVPRRSPDYLSVSFPPYRHQNFSRHFRENHATCLFVIHPQQPLHGSPRRREGGARFPNIESDLKRAKK